MSRGRVRHAPDHEPGLPVPRRRHKGIAWTRVGEPDPEPLPRPAGARPLTPGQTMAARTPASVPEVQEARNRAKYGACGHCDQALTEEHWLAGSDDVGVARCCGESCAQAFYKAHEDEWDLRLYGRCQVDGCRRVIRSPGPWTGEILGEEYVACSRACALQLMRLAASRHGLDPDPRDLAAFRASAAGGSSRWPEKWTVKWVPGRGRRDNG